MEELYLGVDVGKKFCRTTLNLVSTVFFHSCLLFYFIAVLLGVSVSESRFVRGVKIPTLSGVRETGTS